MKKLIFKTLFISASLLFLNSIAQEKNKYNIGHVDTLVSKKLNEKRHFLVHLPDNYYNTWFQPTKYAVIYVLDGDDHFTYLSGMVDYLSMYGKIPPMIVVGITNTNRMRDLSPTKISKDWRGIERDWLKDTGGNTAFLSYIKEELIPLIDSKYRTNGYKLFIGHSLGGITAINALLTMPDVFNCYISIDPSLWWDDKIFVKKFSDRILKSGLDKKYLYLAKANGFKDIVNTDTCDNHLEAINQTISNLETKNRSGLKSLTKYYEKETHGTLPIIATYDGLQYIFDGYDINEKTELLTVLEAQNELSKFSNRIGFNFFIAENTANNIGWEALELKKYEKAFEYFQYNVQNFPKSPSAMESMANYYKEKGDKKNAIVYYEKCSKLVPDNQGIKDKIEALKNK